MLWHQSKLPMSDWLFVPVYNMLCNLLLNQALSHWSLDRAVILDVKARSCGLTFSSQRLSSSVWHGSLLQVESQSCPGWDVSGFVWWEQAWSASPPPSASPRLFPSAPSRCWLTSSVRTPPAMELPGSCLLQSFQVCNNLSDIITF